MPTAASFQPTSGTAIAVFAQNGTYSSVADLGGLPLMGVYADAWTGGALTIRSAPTGAGTGYPVVSYDGTVTTIPTFAAGTLYTFPANARPNVAQYVVLQVGTAGTVASGGGTVVLIGRQF